MEITLLIAAVTLGGLIKGLNGFGYALVSTSLLSIILPAQEAVALMIIPVIAANIEIVNKLSLKEIKAGLRRFKLYIAGTFTGVIAGMLLIDTIPSTLLKNAVGFLVLIFVASRIPKVSRIFSRLNRFCAENPRIEPVLGVFSGVVFGSSNVGVLTVAYFRELDLTREKFVSLIALTILIASIMRIGLASYLGLYTGTEKILVSALLSVPGLISVKFGDMIGEKLPEKMTEKVSMILLIIIGLKLLGTF